MMTSNDLKLSVAAVAIAVATMPVMAHAQSVAPTMREDRLYLPAQRLADSLDRIQARFDVPIEADRKLLADIRAGAVVDAVSADDAVRQALAPTGLTAARSADGRVIGVGKPDPARLDQDIVVTAPRDQAEIAYKADSSSTGNRTGAPNKSLPASSSVVTAQVLADQQAISIDDAVRNVASVKNNVSGAQGAQFYQVRGFVANVVSNGVPVPANIYQPIDSVERVEVLKGPAAILQGEGSLGGTVNVVNKRPTTTTLLNVQVQGGSYNEYKASVDGSTRLTEDGALSGRVIMSGLHQGRTYGGYDGGYQYLFAPSLRFKDETFDLSVGVDYSDVKNPFQPYTLFDADDRLVDREGAIGFRNSFFGFETTNVHADLNVKIAPWLELVARGSHVDLDSEQVYFLPFGLFTPTIIGGLETGQRRTFETWTGDAYLRARFSTGSIRHTVSGGYNHRASSGDTMYYTAVGDPDGGFRTFDIFADGALVDFDNYGVDPTANAEYNYDRSQGYYLQDLIEFGPLHVFGAIRRNLFTSRFRSTGAFGTNSTGFKDDAWTPSGGIVLDLTKTLSVYGNFSRGFFPSSARSRSGERLPPVQSEQYEAGAKFDLNQSKATLTLAGFQITQKNQAQIDPASFTAPTAQCNSANPCYFLAGGLRSRGIEAELAGEVLPGLNLTGSVTRSWYSYKEQEVPLTGDPYASLVKIRGSLWGVYTVQSGRLKDLGFGAGVFAQGDSTVFTGAKVPGYVRGDVAVYYRTGPVSLTAGVRNVFDSKDYSEANSPNFVPVLAPRTFRITLGYRAF